MHFLEKLLICRSILWIVDHDTKQSKSHRIIQCHKHDNACTASTRNINVSLCAHIQSYISGNKFNWRCFSICTKWDAQLSVEDCIPFMRSVPKNHKWFHFELVACSTFTNEFNLRTIQTKKNIAVFGPSSHMPLNHGAINIHDYMQITHVPLMRYILKN